MLPRLGAFVPRRSKVRPPSFGTREPHERALHDPPFGEDFEVVEIGALDDLQLPSPGGSALEVENILAAE